MYLVLKGPSLSLHPCSILDCSSHLLFRLGVPPVLPAHRVTSNMPWVFPDFSHFLCPSLETSGSFIPCLGPGEPESGSKSDLTTYLFLSATCMPVTQKLDLLLGRCQDRRRQWHPTPVLLPGKSHGWGSLVGCSPWDSKESDTTEQLQFHFSLSRIGEGNGNPLQCSCLENPRDGEAWWAAVCGVAQSRTRLK